MKYMLTKKARVWFRVFDSVVILSMLLQPIAPAVIFSQEFPAGDNAAVEAEAPAAPVAETPKAEEKAAPVETKTEEVAAPAVEPTAAPTTEKAVPADVPVVVEETPTETAPVVSEPVQTVEPTEAPAVEAVTPDVPATPTVEAAGEASIEREPAAPEWKKNEDGSRTITVSEGEEYSYPDSGLKIKFTRIDADKNADNAREITVKEVKLSTEQVAELGAVSNTAWDITSTMENGTFAYDLTLPSKDGVDPTKVGVAYAEDVQALSDPSNVQSVDKGDVFVDNAKDEVKAADLDHFTLYLLTYSDASLTIEKKNFAKGESLHYKTTTTALISSKSYRINAIEPNGSTTHTVKACTTGVTSLTGFYDVPAAGPTGTWNLKIEKFDGTSCSGSSTDSGSVSFNVVPVDVRNVSADTFGLTSVTGVWTNTAGGSYINGLNTNEVRWGNGDNGQSGLRFDGANVETFNDGAKFYLGTLTHFNYPINNAASGAKLRITMNFSKPTGVSSPDFSYDFAIEETSNSYGHCEAWQVSSTPCDDRITFPNSYGTTSVQIGDRLYTLRIEGFTRNYPDGALLPSFITEESRDNTAYLVGSLSSVLVEKPELRLVEKSVNDDPADSAPGIDLYVGDTATFKYVVQNTGNVDMRNIVVTDVVTQGGGSLSVVCPQTTLASGASMTCATNPATTPVVAGQHADYATVSGVYGSGGGTAYNNPEKEWAYYFGKNKGTIIVQKNMVGGTGNFTYTGNPSGTISTNNGTITVNNVTPGTYTSTESAATGWTLSSISCDDGSSATPSTTDVSVRSATFKVDPGETVKCTFTNTKQTGTLKVIKNVINDNGGSASASSFNLHVKSGGSEVSGSPAAGSATGTVYTLNAGSYAVSEDAPVSGYAKTGFGGDCNSDGTVDVVAGQEKTCTITNDDIAPSLTLNKILVKDNGGSANESDWALSATGTAQNPTNLSGQGASGSTDVVSGATFKADTYTLSETGGPSGYTASAWTCSNGVNVSSDNKITLGLGKSTVCSITNNDQPSTLTVKKIVKNDNGGTLGAANFGFKVNGAATMPFEADGQNDVTVNAGTYTVTEPGVAGYATTYDNCENVVIPNGGSATCTITNDDIPAHLIVIKHVNNDQGGSASSADFTMTINGITVNGGSSFPGQEAPGTDKTVMPGSYTVTESGPDGYQSSMSADCAGTIAIGQTKTCTVTNEDKPATLIVKKHVVNDNGGVANADAFTMNVTGKNVSDDSFAGSESGTTVTLDAGSYSVSEDAIAGYEASYSGCSGTILNGQTKTCTVTNDDKSPHLIVKKRVVNDSDGTKVATQFSTTISGVATANPTANGSESGVDNVLTTVGSYTVDEGAHAGYEKALSSECDGSIALGETKTCTITNDDIDSLPTIEVSKSAGVSSVPESGADVTYTFIVNNTSVVDPVNITSLSDDRFGTLAGDADCMVGTVLAVGGACNFTVTKHIDGNAGTSHTNVFTVNSSDNEGNPVTDTDEATVTFTDVKPTIEVAKSANPTTLPEPGGDATFSVTVKNTSFEPVTLTSLSDNVYGDLNGKGTCATGGTIASGSEYACSFTGSVSGEPGSHTDIVTATVTDNDGSTDTKQDDATVTITDAKPKIEVTKTADVATIQEPGGDVTYTFDVKNTSATESVAITMLADDKFGALTGDADCQVGTVLAAGASCSFQSTKSISGDANTSHVNVFRAIAVDNESNNADDSDDATVTFTDAKPSVTIEKSVDQSAMAEPGGDFTYTLTIKNTSVETVSITALTDSNALSPACLALVGQAVAPNATKTCSYAVNHAIAGSYGNTATVTVKDNENNTAQDDDSETVKVVGARIGFDQLSPVNDVNDPHTFTVTVTENDGTGWIAASGEHVDFTLTDGGGAVPTLDLVQSTCDDAGANTDTNGQCKIVFNSATPGTVTVHASASVSVGGLTLARSTNGTLGSSADAVKTYQAGKIIIEKQTSPDGSTQSFEFTPNYGQKFSLSDNGTNDSGYLAPGTYSVSEAVPTGWTQVSAVCSDQSPVGAISLQAGETVTCIFVNGELPTLTLNKTVTNDNGGNATTANFQGMIGADSVAWGSVTTLTPGAYTANESVLAGGEGYLASGWGTDCSENGSVTLTYGDHKTCTITNDDKPGTLVVKKIVTNDNGGTLKAENFGFKVNGTDAVSFETDGQNDITVNAGTYSVVENTAAGYATTYDNCENVVIPNGGTATCTITNDDIQPKLTVYKIVDNGDGGGLQPESFTIRVTGTDVSPASFPGNSSGTAVALNAGTFSVTEDAVAGYAASYKDDCSGTIAVGDVKTCTITNNDVAPTLTVVKTVVNDNGGTKEVKDFALSVDGNPVTSGSAVTLLANHEYSVSELNLSGYDAGKWGGDCSSNGKVTLQPGTSKICTITNDDKPGTLVVKKIVKNDNRGTLKANGFSFKVNDGGSVSFEADGQNDITVNAGTYSVVENSAAGYTTTYDNCENVAIANGETKTCTITNDDKPGTLVVKKIVTNDNGGTLKVENFGFKVNGSAIVPFEADGQNDITVNAGTYSVVENSAAGYAVTYEGCSNIRIAIGETKTCTITNNDKAPKLTLVKNVTNNNGGNAKANDWTLKAEGPTTISGAGGATSDAGFDAGTYALSETGGPTGYTAGNWSCTNGVSVSAGKITLGLDKTTTCTIVNDDQPGKLKVVKMVDNANGGDMKPNDFDLEVNHGNVSSGSWNTYDANRNLSITEDQIAGYSRESVVCASNVAGSPNNSTQNVLPKVVSLANGEEVTCTILNKSQFGHIVVEKQTLPDGDRTKFEFDPNWGGDFELRDGERHDSGILVPGTYSVHEHGESGWDMTNVTCSDGSDPNRIALDPGEIVTCTFTNTKRAEITVKKDAIPDDSQDFVFRNNFGNGIPSSFTLDDDGWNFWPGHSNQETFEVKPNTYAVSENELSGWKQEGATCSDGSAVSAINAAPGEHITCTFTNKKLGKIKLVKKAIGSDGTFDFAMSGTTLPESASLTTANGSAMQMFSGIDPDNTYGISEAERAGWSLTGVRCVDEKKDVKFDCDKDGRHDEGRNDSNNDKDDNRDKRGDHIDPAEFSMNPGGEMTCTFTNTRDTGRITVNKVIDADGNLETTGDRTAGTGWTFDVNGTGTDTGNPVPGLTGTDGSVPFTGLKTGQYSVAETTQDGYKLIEANCGTGNGSLDGNTVYGVTVSKDAETVCTFYNTPDGTIHGQKWEDRDMDRERDAEGEPYLSGWTIFLDEDGDGGLDDGERSTQTSSDENEFGWYWFDHLFPGTYSVCEVMQDGWEQTYPAGETSCHTVTLPENGQKESVQNYVEGPAYDFGNAKLGLLSIEKENDATAPKMPGETVKYTLKVTASEGKVLDVKTTDLPPEVATYVPNSWTAESSLGAAHVGNLLLEHVYASPGIWDLGQLQEGEVITLSYDATVNDGTDAGEYPDLAYAQGYGQGGNLYAMAGVGGNLEDGRYVGTAIAVADTDDADPARVTTDHTEKEKKIVKERVLGATLPETGSPAFWMLIAVVLLGLGSLGLGAGYAMKNDMFKKICKRCGKGAAILLFAMIIGMFGGADAAKADSVPDLYVRAEKPEPMANGSFILDFVTLDTDKTGAIGIECQVQKPGESDFATFQSMTVQEGGDSGQCSVGAAELPDDGTYVFRVRATSGSEVATSKESSVSYDTIFPGKPKSIDKSYVSSCINRVKLRTADDGQTTHVEVYRSTSEDFIADATTLVHTAAVGPNATYEYDDTRPSAICGDKTYYAVRAFDDAGNASPVREEDITETNRVTVYEDVTDRGGVTLTPGAAGVAGGAGTGAENAGTGTEQVTGTVEGAQTPEQGTVEGAETAAGGSNTWIWVIIAGAAAYGTYRYYIARGKKTTV